MPELAFFVGKGGVGKTTVSAAYALARASQSSRSRVLLVSTDPAHSLADILKRKLGASRTTITVPRGKMSAWEINSAHLFRAFVDAHRQDLIETVERGSLFTAAEISSLLDTALPGMSEIAALLAIQEAIESDKYSDIVVDTAPFGHTLRLFALPEQFLRLLTFLELSADRDRILAQHFGGRFPEQRTRFVDEWRAKIDALQNAFASARLFLVTTPERFALNESVRCMHELRETNPDLALRAVVLNRVVLRGAKCKCCKNRAHSARVARSMLRKEFPSAKLFVGEDPGAPILGLEELRRFAAHVFEGKAVRLNTARVKTNKDFNFQLTPASWPDLTAPLSFVLGKGGVGKTTISAGLGFHSRERSQDSVEICSVDPAPSLDDIFEKVVGDTPVPVLGDPNFRASELDSVALFKSWVREIREEVESSTTAQYSGVHLDVSYERKLFSELLEIVPPGLDEVLAIFRVIELQGGLSRRVVVDMAPTGHALELLRMPERILVWARLLLKSLAAHRKLALARDAAVKIAELEVRARELATAFKSSRQAQVFAVMLAEPLPDRETERLICELRHLNLHPQAVFVNRVLLPGASSECTRCRSALQWQNEILSRLKSNRRGKKIYVVENFDHELYGKRGLRELTGQLWQLN